jgi:RNA polymerase sigma-70 factor (ECF subfamily)
MQDHLLEAEAMMVETANVSDSVCYDLVWATNITKQAWQHLQNAFEEEGKAESLEILKPFIVGTEKIPLSQDEAADKLRIPIATLRTWLSRLRRRYREALRMEVARTVSDSSEVDQELRYLYQILTA